MNFDDMQAEIEKLARVRAAGHAVTWVGERLYGPARAAEILDQIESEDIDPDNLPRADLSGQWADEPTARDILADIGYGGDSADEYATDLVDAYETEYASHAEHEITRILTAHAGEDSLQRIEHLSVSDLDTMADAVYSPDRYPSDGSAGSAGAELLALARDVTVGKLRERMRVYDTETPPEAIAAVYDDLPAEVADETVDDSHGVWAEFVDLGAWTEDVRSLYDPAAFNALETAAHAAVSEIVQRLAVAILNDVRDRT